MYKSANNNYNPFCLSIKKELEQNGTSLFLQNKHITGILGVSEDYGHRYALALHEEFPEIVERCNHGDLQETVNLFLQVGGAPLFQTGFFSMPVSAYMMRYLYHACLICKYLNESYPNVKGLLEIGGGFGGLAFWIQKLSPTPPPYFIYDLNEAMMLQKECLQYWKTPLPLVDWSPQSYEENTNDTFEWNHLFVISNYAYSELSSSFQEYYKHSILEKVGGGFMIWNNLTGIPAFTRKQLHIVAERPYFPENDNKFIYF